MTKIKGKIWDIVSCQVYTYTKYIWSYEWGFKGNSYDRCVWSGKLNLERNKFEISYLSQLPYSVDEIYRIKGRGKNKEFERVYTDYEKK